jgi:hypothetical protein
MTRQTRTYATLEVTLLVFREIEKALRKAGYHHAFMSDDGRPAIDMHGIALVAPEGVTWEP